MDVPGFSRVQVSALLEDEEDERQRAVGASQTLYAKAQDAFAVKGSRREVLQLFEQAEAAMAEHMGGGLTGLAPEELQMVLKGRLHMALILTQMPEQPGQWAKVRSLVEDVLQADFNNCHAHWLRGLALLRGAADGSGAASVRSKAEAEMRLAVSYARASGKESEAAQWEAEIERCFAEGGGTTAEAASETHAAGEALAAAADASSEGRADVDCTTSPTTTSAARTAAPALQKGFFNRPRAAARTRSSGPPSTQPVGEAEPTREARAASSSGGPDPAAPAAAAAAALEAAEAELRELRDAAAATSAEAERRHARDLEQLRAELREARAREAGLMEEQGRQRERADLCSGQLRELEAELEESLLVTAGACTAAGGVTAAEAEEELQQLQAAADELAGKLRAARSWAEAEHSKFTDCATEVATLREMAAREFRERQAASKQLVADIKGLAQKMGDLKAVARVLRDNVRRLGGRGEDGADAPPDIPRLAADAAEFRKLTQSAKLRAFLDDAAVLWLLAAAFVAGALLALAVAGEAFGIRGCRLVCAR